MKFSAKVIVKLKYGVKDPQGIAAENTIRRIDIDKTASIKAGKYYEIEIEESDELKAREKLEKICSEVLSNPVLERYEIIGIEKE